MSKISLHKRQVEIPLWGMELGHNFLCGGMNKLTIRKSHKPPHIEKRMNSIPRQGNLLVYTV